MDLLSQRYANPYAILDDFIRLKQLHDFSTEIMQVIADENVQKARWEYYLHKVWDSTSFEEYVAACDNQKPAQTISEIPREEAMQIIRRSGDILENFTLQ